MKPKILCLLFILAIPTVFTLFLGPPGLMLGVLLAFVAVMEVLKKRGHE